MFVTRTRLLQRECGMGRDRILLYHSVYQFRLAVSGFCWMSLDSKKSKISFRFNYLKHSMDFNRSPWITALERAHPADRLIRLPDALSFDAAAVVTFNGITVQYLLKSTWPVGSDCIVLLYGTAGALGQLMVP